MSGIRGLFINNKKARDSIYESGFMVYQCLSPSGEYQLDYQEIDINNRQIPTGYDFYFFNYHPATMNWLDTRQLRKQLGFCITMVLEVAPDDPFVLCPSTHFDIYCALDPTIKSKNSKVYAFPRPLERFDTGIPDVHHPIPVIGTFGFATKGKGFQHVVEAVNQEFEKATVRINIPYGDFVPRSKEYALFLGNICRETAKEGIDVQITHDFISKESLVKWCASNTLNCFLYDRSMPGLAATTDQAITSGRPLSVSDNETFRHITAYLPPYPLFSLKDSIEKSQPMVQQMQRDWSPENFKAKFENVLTDHAGSMGHFIAGNHGSYLLPLKKKNLFDTLILRYKKYKRKIKKIRLNKLFNPDDTKHGKKII